MITICTQCTHYLSTYPDGRWYGQFCTATSLKRGIDPVSGAEKSTRVNDLGMRYYTDELYAWCREVNTGNCPKFTAQEPLESMTSDHTSQETRRQDN